MESKHPIRQLPPGWEVKSDIFEDFIVSMKRNASGAYQGANYNPQFKGVKFDPLLAEAGNNSFTMSPSRWVERTAAIGIITKNGAGGDTFAQRDIAFKFASWVSFYYVLGVQLKNT